MERFGGRIAGNDKIGIVAESLQAAIPHISMNVIIGARWEPKKFNMPRSGKNEPNDDNASGKSWFKFWLSEKFPDREEVHDSRKCQRCQEVRPTPVAEVA